MDAAPKPCCVCDAPGGKHCTKCKSRHYCSKACQLFDWKRGHNKACKQLTAEFQDRLLDELMPAKLKIKEEPAIVDEVALADGSKARLPAVRAAKTAEGGAPSDDVPSWRGTCAICLDLLPIEGNRQTFYFCCCKRLCAECSVKCIQRDQRCPLCRTLAHKSEAEMLRRLQKHVDKGNVEAQIHLASTYFYGDSVRVGDKEEHEAGNSRAFELYELAAAQGHPVAQARLGQCYQLGVGVEVDYQTAAQWNRRAAEQGYPDGQCNLGVLFYDGQGVAQSYEEAVKWYRLAAAQGDASALFSLGTCYANGYGVPRDYDEALPLQALRGQGGRRSRERSRTARGVARGGLRPADVIAAGRSAYAGRPEDLDHARPPLPTRARGRSVRALRGATRR